MSPQHSADQKSKISLNGRILSLDALLVGLAVLCIFRVIAVYFANDFASGGGDFKTGDWLINYSSGFVRRGLIGEMLMMLPLNGESLLRAVFFTQSAIYVLVCILYVRCFFKAGGDIRSSYFLFSPAGILLFPLNDPSAALRKEILVYLSHLLLLMTLKSKLSPWQRRFMLFACLCLYSVALFSHELTAFALPFFIFPLVRSVYDGEEKKTDLIVSAAVLILLTGIGLLSAVFFHGDQDTVSGICNYLTARGLSGKLCGGAVGWLAGTGATVSTHFSDFGRFYLGYLLIAVLAIIPFLAFRRLDRVLWRELLICAMGLSPLFFVAIDWGRWIHIYFVLSSQLIFFDYFTRGKKLPQWNLILIFIYCVSWGVPHYCPQWQCYKIGLFR